LLGWDSLGDGSVYAPMAAREPDSGRGRTTRQVRAAYGRSLAYSLGTLISFLRTYGDDRTVLIMLGDHQPIPEATGADAGRDVPITIIARDRAVLDRVAGWGWRDGLRPPPDAPVWTMDSFRQRFVETFSARAP
jgi:hypothetical protein